MKNKRKFIRILTIPAILFTVLSSVILICRRTAVSGATIDDRKAFAKSIGYTVSADSETVRNIVIPAIFGNVYENYNTLQKECGFDLSLYKGEEAVQYTYNITDYIDESGNALENIRMNLIVCNGKIIGGDISSAELDGFMTGLKAK